MLVFHNDSDSSYANYAGNLSSMSIAAGAVTLRFLGQGSSTSGTDAVVLACAAGNEEIVLEAVASAAAEGRSSMTIVASDVAGKTRYLIPEITGVTSISVNTGAAHIQNIITTNIDRTLTVAESGSTVIVNHAAREITLPAAQAGLNYEIVWAIHTTAGAKVITNGTDAFFGTVVVNSATKAKNSSQTVALAVTSKNELQFVNNSQTLGGQAGDSVRVTCVNGLSWMVDAALTTSGNDPDAIAVIV